MRWKTLTVLLTFILLPSLAWAQNVKVTPPYLEAEPGSFPSFVASFSNTTENPLIYDLNLEIPEGWGSMEIPESVTVNPGTETVFITVIVSPRALAGVHKCTLKVSRAEESIICDFDIAVAEIRGVEVNALSEGKRVEVGETVTYTFQVRNRGNSSEKFKLEATSLNEWKTRLSEKTVEIPPYGKKNVDVVIVSADTSVVEDILIMKVISEDGVISDDSEIETKVMPQPPEKVKGSLIQKVPSYIRLSGSGTKEEYRYWLGLSGGRKDPTKDRWIRFYLGAPYEVDEEEEEIEKMWRLDYGHKDKWELNAGDIETDLGPLTDWEGRGGRFQTWGKKSSLTLTGTGAKEEDAERYGAKAEFGERTKLGLGYVYSPENRIKGFEEENIYSLQLGRELREDWNISGEYAVLADGKEDDKAWEVKSTVETDKVDLELEYYNIGTSYPLGLTSGEEKTSFSSYFYPLDFGLSYANSRNLEDYARVQEASVEKIIGRNPAFRFGYGWREEKREETEQREGLLGGFNWFARPLSLYFSGRWDKEKPEPEYSFAGYDGRLALHFGDTEIWYAHEEDIEEEEEEAKKDEIGIHSRFNTTFLTLKSSQEFNDETTRRASIDLGFRLSKTIHLFLGLEREEFKGEEEWTTKFGIFKSFFMPTPWIKDKGRITGFVFDDANENGALDEGEEGLSGIILTSDGKQAITKNGRFVFPSSKPRIYDINVELPSGLEATIDLPIRVRLKEGETLELLIPVIRVGQIAGFVFNDENQNGKKDEGETGVGNVRVIITGKDFSKETLTNMNGRFSISLPAEEYTVRIDEFSLPKGYSLTTQRSITISLAQKERKTLEFGAKEKEREIIITEF